MKTFQEIIANLKNFWGEYGCSIIEPIDTEVGAGTLHPATILRVLDSKKWNVAYVQPCRRPADARWGKNPNRLSFYHQFQVILKPAPHNIQDLYLKSLEIIGIDVKNNDIRFVEDDWENPSVGASGLGWEVWFNGMEISQFTYMQQVGGIKCKITPGEITYGLERMVMHIQDVESVFDIVWNRNKEEKTTFKDLFFQSELENSSFILEHSNISYLLNNFNLIENQVSDLINKKLITPAFELSLKASHILNLLDARNVISANERFSYLARVRQMVRQCCELQIKNDAIL